MNYFLLVSFLLTATARFSVKKHSEKCAIVNGSMHDKLAKNPCSDFSDVGSVVATVVRCKEERSLLSNSGACVNMIEIISSG